MPIKDAKRIAALIIAGGRGTRFWPESRAGRPKPLFSIDGKTSLLANTIARMQPLVATERIFVLVSADQAADFRRAIRGLIPPHNLIVEPEGRGTAVAIAYGAAVIGKRTGDDTIVAIMPADHFVAPVGGFRRTITAAAGLASNRSVIVVVGITPTRPETGYGYQEAGPAVGRGFKVARFVEKPQAAMADKMVRSGRFLWNAGMFVMRVATLAAELEQHAPVLAAAMRTFPEMNRAELKRNYSKLVFDSFDRVVVEKSANILGVRARFRWHDVGSWEGLWEALRGSEKNLLYGNAVAIDAEGVLARAGNRLMVLLGVSDLVAVDTGDVILIARRSQSQDVRRVVAELQRRGLTRYL
jgi:mannose-1-phosphate guanylyltransferase/mannose-6-phosphate isomerase